VNYLDIEDLKYLSLATTYEIDDSFDSEKFIKMRLRVCHDGVNPNKSFFKVEGMEEAKDSIKNIPILANVIFDEDGNPQFGGHDFDIEEDKTKEGEYRIIYKETPIGVVPENCNHEIKEFNGKNYTYCDAYVWKDYSNYAQDIIERDKDIKLSMEILVDGYSYDAKEKVFNITDYRYKGITFLNKNYGTGMENALATTETFSEDSKEKLIIMMEELKEALANYNIKTNEKGGSGVDEKVVELLKEYNLTQDNMPFSVEGLSFEDIKSKLEELYSKESNSDENKKPEKFVKSFELSHEEIRYALYQLLSPIESEDNEWYFIDRVYDDKFEYENWDGTKIYRQAYKKDGDNVSFEGERIQLFQERLTKEEKEALDKMRSNYSQLEAEVVSLKEFKSIKLAEERKQAEEEIFSRFIELEGIEEFELLKQKASEFTLEQLEKEIAFIIVKNNVSFKFSEKSSKNDKVKLGFSKKNEESVGKYDDLFEKYKNKK